MPRRRCSCRVFKKQEEEQGTAGCPISSMATTIALRGPGEGSFIAVPPHGLYGSLQRARLVLRHGQADQQSHCGGLWLLPAAVVVTVLLLLQLKLRLLRRPPSELSKGLDVDCRTLRPVAVGFKRSYQESESSVLLVGCSRRGVGYPSTVIGNERRLESVRLHRR